MPAGPLLIHDNAGGVHVDRVIVGRETFVTDSTLVTFHDCKLLDSVSITGSNAQLAQSRITSGPKLYEASGVTVSDGTVAIQSCQINGGPAANTGTFVSIESQAGPALHALNDAEVIVSGRSWLVAGPGIGTPAVWVESRSSVTFDFSVVLLPSAGGNRWLGTVDFATFPTLEVNGTRAAGALVGITVDKAFTSVAVLLSLPGAPQATPFGELWLNPQALVIDQGSIGANGVRPFFVPLGTSVPPGLVVTLQVLAMRSSGPFASAPTTIVLGL